MPLVFGLLSLCVLVLGATLAQLGLTLPVTGLYISLASLPLSLLSIVSSFIRAYQRSQILAVCTSFAAWPAPVVFATHAIETVELEYRKASIDIRPIRTTLPIDLAFQAAIDEIEQHDDWSLGKVDRKRHLLEAHAMSRVFQFRHVFAIKMRRQNDQTVVDVASLSRPERWDVGGQRREIANFLRALDRRFSTPDIRL
jgi:hypothetical protein